MDIGRAYEIIRMLAEGKDPYTGQALQGTSPFHQSDTAAALTMALDGMRFLENKLKREEERPRNAGQPWGTEEDGELVKAYKCGHSIQEIARMHQRTQGAVTSRLFKLGVIRIPGKGV